MPGLHAQEPHGARLWRAARVDRRPSYRGPRAVRRGRPTGPAPARARAGRARTASPASPRAAGGLERRQCTESEERRRAPRRGCTRSRGRRRRDVAGPASRTSRSPSKKGSDGHSRCPPVTTTARGPSACTARARLVGSVSPLRVARQQRRASAEVRRDDGGPRQQSLDERGSRGSGASSRAPDSATITGSTTSGVPGSSRSSAVAPPRPAASPSIPVFTASTPMSSATARTCSTITSGARLHRRHPHGVLRGERGDCGHPVPPARGEGLEIGLDAGPATGVRAGDASGTRGTAWRRG